MATTKWQTTVAGAEGNSEFVRFEIVDWGTHCNWFAFQKPHWASAPFARGSAPTMEEAKAACEAAR